MESGRRLSDRASIGRARLGGGLAGGPRLDTGGSDGGRRPERLNRGILDLLPNAVSAEARLVRASSWLTALLQRWDAANAWWTENVVKYDFKAQVGILQRLGIDSPDASDLGWALAGGLVLWMVWIAWQYGARRTATAA